MRRRWYSVHAAGMHVDILAYDARDAVTTATQKMEDVTFRVQGRFIGIQPSHAEVYVKATGEKVPLSEYT